jgi:hypothetical protein
VLLGVLHADLDLVGLWQAGDRAGGALGPPEGRRAVGAPGTWLVGVMHGQLALLRPDLQTAVYLTNRGLPQALLSVAPRNPSAQPLRPEASLRLDGGGRLDGELAIPLGGDEAPRGVLLARLRLAADAAQVRATEGWAFGAGR